MTSPTDFQRSRLRSSATASEQRARQGQASDIEPASLETSLQYQKLLNRIAWNIRRTLDLSTIWQRTVDGLGEALMVSRCIVCPYAADSPTVKVVAEYCQTSPAVMLNKTFWILGDSCLNQAIASLQPVGVDKAQYSQTTPFLKAGLVADETGSHLASLGGEPQTSAANCHADNSGKLHWCQPSLPPELEPKPEPQGVEAAQCPNLLDGLWRSALIVVTSYQDHPNGIIVLFQDDQRRRWTDAELDFMTELVDQVGTAIAHANLIADSRSLAEELQRTNATLVRKHEELEEARHQAEEASRLKSEFLANTSHELRTPLNGMIGFLKLVLDGMADDPEEQEEFIGEAYRSALHLLNVINDILDIAKIEAGKLQIDLSPVRLNELLEDVEDLTHSQVHEKQLSFEIQQPPTGDELILHGNYQRLLQVMLNLVGNAIKFTHEGGITVSTEISIKKLIFQEHEFPGTVKIRVADTGIGVSLDKQDKLFQSFSQVDGSRTRQYGGTGLGLAISQRLVEAMGGVVNFYSMGEGLGSTVTFTVPLYQEPVMVSSPTSDMMDLLPS